MDFNDGDYGFGLGLACLISGGVALIAEWWIVGVILLVAAWALCWWYG